ncbi:UNVERIFIED_CONTAM: hypothetical protein GTU68_002503 [Idotea baltica]|nr:hypothetical protein [Idotea baltica]
MLKDSKLLIKELRKYSEGEISELMSISPKLAALNVERYASFKTPFTTKNAKPCLTAFKGDVYTDIEVEDYSKAEFNFAQKRLRILSGLYGVLRPLDLIQAYRLEMKTKLGSTRGDSLYEFWGNRISQQLNEALSETKSKTVVNLASNEYFKAVKANALDGEVFTPIFKEQKAAQLKVIAIYAKRARGMMANYIIRNKIKKVDELKKFSAAGYRFNASESSENDFVFSRKL